MPPESGRFRTSHPPMRMMFDSREVVWQAAINRLPGGTNTRPNDELHVFRLHMKYFSVDVQLFEKLERRRVDGSTYVTPTLTAIIVPQVDEDSIVTLLPENTRRLDPRASLLNLAPYLRSSPVLRIDWQSDTASKPRRADASAWRTTVLDAGTANETLDKFTSPNRHIKYRPH